MFLTKRRKFILSSLLLTAGLCYTQFGRPTDRYQMIALLSFLAIPLTWWSLEEALSGPIWLVYSILPAFFTAGVGLFYFLLPASILVAFPVMIFFFLGMYALFLSENIFAVATIRTIQLFRSASAVSFLLILVISFLLYDTVFSFRLPYYYNSFWVFVISFPLFLHGTWSVNLEEKITSKILLFSFILSLGIGEIALVLSFWPTTMLTSLFLTSLTYVSLGLAQASLSDRLFNKTIKEYLFVGIAVLVILLFYTTWG